MTPKDRLLIECNRVEEQGLGFVMLKVARKHPRRTNRIRVLPGCTGTIVGIMETGVLLVSAPASELRKALEKQ